MTKDKSDIYVRVVQRTDNRHLKHFQFVCENSHLFICTHAKTLVSFDENFVRQHVRRVRVIRTTVYRQ